MTREARFREVDHVRLDQLREAALTLRALELAAKEAQLDRDELITFLMVQARDGGSRIAEAAFITKAWPAKIRDAHPTRSFEWRREHPDRMALLLEARDRLDNLIAAEEGKA